MLGRFALFFLIFPSVLAAQDNYPKAYFRSPVDTALSLAGNFGELRPGHIHAGFDIRTGNREGMKVFAVAEGYISRIKISPYGYGKALYITHPNGYTSVYGHLSVFADSIASFTRNAQYALQSFEIDTMLSPAALPVSKGQLIALSGNTGGSEGPHLHFEIRETKGDLPVNPYFFGYFVPDTVRPRIASISVYPLGERAAVNGKHAVKRIRPVYKKGKYSFLRQDTIAVNGEIGFGIECYDQETGSLNQNAVFSIEMQSGGKRIFYQELEKISFENSRYVNAHIDFAEKQTHGKYVQKCFLSRNNKLEIYKDVVNRGILNFTGDSIHWIRFIVKDYYGNSAELMLKVRGIASMSAPAPVKPALVLDCTKENIFSKDDIRILIPEGALYDDLPFTYSYSSHPKMFSKLHHVQDRNTALQKSMKLSLLVTGLPEALSAKAAIVSFTDKGKMIYEGGKFENGWITALTKDLGDFAVTIDTVPPQLRPAVRIRSDSGFADLRKSSFVGVFATDNLSGIHHFRATIDGRWALCEYELKKNLLFCPFDQDLLPGPHIFYIDVEDDRGNTSSMMISFVR